MTNEDKQSGIDRLLSILKTLRSPLGCPWDKNQTPESLKTTILEEAYELLEAIDSKNSTDICDEAGDLLLQIVFLGQIFSERDNFEFNDIANTIADKMVRRHPHVFGKENSNGHIERWEEIKQEEKNRQGKSNTLKQAIPRHLPALKACSKIAKKEKTQAPLNCYSELIRTTKNLGKHTQEKEQLGQTLPYAIYLLVNIAIENNLDIEDLLRQFNNDKIAAIDNRNS